MPFTVMRPSYAVSLFIYCFFLDREREVEVYWVELHECNTIDIQSSFRELATSNGNEEAPHLDGSLNQSAGVGGTLWSSP